MHAQEEDVQKLILYPKGPQRQNMIDSIRHRGNHILNMETLKNDEGMFVPQKRISIGESWKMADYSPCPHCNVWLLGRLLWKHQKNCTSIKSHQELQPSQIPAPLPSMSERELILQADIVAGRISTEASAELKNEVFPYMKSDWIGKVARSDPLICLLGNLAMKRNIGNKPMRRLNVASVMRLSARALIELRDLHETEDGKKLLWFDALVPEQYDNIVKAVFAVCRESYLEEAVEEEGDEDDLEAPSNACLLYTSPSPRDRQKSRMPSSA